MNDNYTYSFFYIRGSLKLFCNTHDFLLISSPPCLENKNIRLYYSLLFIYLFIFKVEGDSVGH